MASTVAAATPFPPSPMLATTGALPSDTAAYVFEPKFDGIRALARIDHQPELFSRHATHLTSLGVRGSTGERGRHFRSSARCFI
jgi:ATP-dependent DNA ligase